MAGVRGADFWISKSMVIPFNASSKLSLAYALHVCLLKLAEKTNVHCTSFLRKSSAVDGFRRQESMS
jgi:hypothetical protein